MPDRERPKGKLTGTAARAVNDLLHYLGVQERPAKHPTGVALVDPLDARTAAVLLADLAHNGLYAGLDGDDVLHTWNHGTTPRTLTADHPSDPVPAGLGSDTCGARHPTLPTVRCLFQLGPDAPVPHPRTYHEAPNPDHPDDLNRVVWAVDAFGPKVRPKPPVNA